MSDNEFIFTALSTIAPVALDDPKMGKFVIDVREDFLNENPNIRIFLVNSLNELIEHDELNSTEERFNFIKNKIDSDRTFQPLHNLVLDVFTWAKEEQISSQLILTA